MINNVTCDIMILDGGHIMNFGKENELLEFKLTTKELDDSLRELDHIKPAIGRY